MAPNKHLIAFINSIPDSKLTGLPRSGRTLTSDGTFRIDMQGMTSDKPPKHNLQVQVNDKPSITSYAGVEGETVAGPVLCGSGKDEWTADKIRAELIKKIVPPEKLVKAKKPLPKPMSRKGKWNKSKRN